MSLLTLSEITKIEDPRVSEFHNLKAKINIKDPFFIADGLKVVLKALRCKMDIQKIYAHKSFYESNEVKELASSGNIECLFSEKKIMQNIVGHNLHQYVMAKVSIPGPTNITNFKGPIIALNAVNQAENVGSIIRNAVGLGCSQFIFEGSGCHPYLRRSVRVSMGAIFNSKYYVCDNLLQMIPILKSNGHQIVCAELSENSQPINTFSFQNNTLLIFGNESSGISQDILDMSDHIVNIQMNNNIESLNVASSSAIFIHKLMENILLS